MTVMTLEDLIRDCAARGEMVHLSLWFEPTNNRWCATYSPSHQFGVSKAFDADPVTAAVKALEGIKHARTRTRNVIVTEGEPEAPLERAEGEGGESNDEAGAESVPAAGTDICATA